MRQANELGGHVRKGEESTIIVFWKVEDRRGQAQDASDAESDEQCRRRFVLRYYRVWNVEQCELPENALEKLARIETHEHGPIEAAERIIAQMPNPPEIQHSGSKAFYSPITDRITLPPRELFVSVEEFYATALHETVHYVDFRIMPNGRYLALSGPVCSVERPHTQGDFARFSAKYQKSRTR
jgi:antirestriction protein ArdC